MLRTSCFRTLQFYVVIRSNEQTTNDSPLFLSSSPVSSFRLYRTPHEDRNCCRPLKTSFFGISSCTRPCCHQRCSDTDRKVGQLNFCGAFCVLILSMSFRVGGRPRRIRGRGSRKADRAPKSAADLDAEMEVCTFETFCCLPNLRLWPLGLYCRQWSCCRCLSNFDFSVSLFYLYIVYRLSMLAFSSFNPLLLSIPFSVS